MFLTGGRIEGGGKLSITGTANTPGNLWAGGVPGGANLFIGITEVTIDVNSTMTVVSDITLENGLDLQNDGSIIWIIGNIAIPGTIEVTNRGSFLISGTGNRSYGGGGPLGVFTNYGSFTVLLATPTDTIQFSSRLEDAVIAGVNNPPLTINQGTLFLNARVNERSTIVVAGAVPAPNMPVIGQGTGGLTITTPFFNAYPGSSIAGLGNLRVTGVIVAMRNTIFNVSPQLTLDGGWLQGAGSFLLGGGMYLTNGATIDTTTVNVTGKAIFNAPAGGFIAATLNSYTLSFNGGTWDGGVIRVNGATLMNYGSFAINSVDSMNEVAGIGSRFENAAAGIINFGAGIGNTMDITFTTAGTVNLNAAVNFTRDFTQTAGIVILNAGVLDLSKAGAARGTYTISGGVLRANGTINNGNVIVQQGGTLELSSVFTLGGDLTVNVGATLQVDVNGVSILGSMTAAGSVTLSGTLAPVSVTPVVLGPGGIPLPPPVVMPPRGTKKTIISAAGGVNRPPADPAGWKTTALNATDIELEKL